MVYCFACKITCWNTKINRLLQTYFSFPFRLAEIFPFISLSSCRKFFQSMLRCNFHESNTSRQTVHASNKKIYFKLFDFFWFGLTSLSSTLAHLPSYTNNNFGGSAEILVKNKNNKGAPGLFPFVLNVTSYSHSNSLKNVSFILWRYTYLSVVIALLPITSHFILGIPWK